MDIRELVGLSPLVREALARELALRDEELAGALALRDEELAGALALRDKAMCGDIAYAITPATADQAATESGWTQALVIELVTAAGEVHEWFNGTIATAASVADTSALGGATISSTSLVFVKGVATLTLTGSAHAWVADETATVTFPTKTILGKALAEKTHVTTIIAAG